MTHAPRRTERRRPRGPRASHDEWIALRRTAVHADDALDALDHGLSRLDRRLRRLRRTLRATLAAG